MQIVVVTGWGATVKSWWKY